MPKLCTLAFFIVFMHLAQSQAFFETPLKTEQDSLKKRAFLKNLGNGYLPTKYFNFDLRYLVKYNQYEALRTGLGGTTNENFSEKLRLNGYVVYGFRDHRFKYSLGGGIRLAEKTNTWLNVFYKHDLEETGSSTFLTDKRFFQLFEPRLLNISLFHKIITKSVSIEHQISPKLLGELQFSINGVNPTYGYNFVLNEDSYSSFNLSMTKIAIQWSPFSLFEISENKIEETKSGYPKFTFQYTKSFKDVFNSDFNFSKLEFKSTYQLKHGNEAVSELSMVSGVASGHVPLTHLYHTYPNNINKEKILRRFSVAGTNSFETMFFNEFFSDRFATFQLKHSLKPFRISEKFKPQLVLINRFAIGDMTKVNRHQNITFDTLNKGFTESGFEINKLLFGFGLSFAYRYGAYHLPNIDDNIAVKFTFNVTL